MMAAMLAAGRPTKNLRTFFQVNYSPDHPVAAPLYQRNTRNILKATLGACYAKFLSSDAFSDCRSGRSSYATARGRRVSISTGTHQDRYRIENVCFGLLQDPVVLRTIRDFSESEKTVEELQDCDTSTSTTTQGFLEENQILKSHVVASGVSFTSSSLRSRPFLSGGAYLLPFERSQVRSFRTSSRHQQHKTYARHANHHYYDVLGVTPRATQTQIKSAYYKKSMQFHPDRNKTEYAADRFTEITEAYEVLGHVDLRRKYDSGVLSRADLMRETRAPSTPPEKNTRRTYSDTRVQSRDNLGYDMDEWMRGHYGEALEQEQRRKRMRKHYEEYKKMEEKSKNESYIAVALIAVAAVFVFLLK